MTNKALSHFKESIHHTLKAKEVSGQFCVSEQEYTSIIKNIYFNKGNRNFLIIRQDANCMAIKNLFEDKKILDSCDFIVLLCKKKLHIFFCEIKSSMSKENCQKAFKQMRSSKIFLEYLYQNYKEHFNSDFEMSVEEGEYVYIYPASNSQKTPTYAKDDALKQLKYKKVAVANGDVNADIYNFFNL